MPHAELHGKISSLGSNLSNGMEDLLTSDVFGRLRYLAPNQGLVPILRTALCYGTGQLGVPLPGDVTGFTAAFWPRYARAEPDVVLWLETTGGPMVVLVECKYRSRKSGEDDPTGIQTARESIDQLVREFEVLRELANGGPCALLYVTGHRLPPLEELEASARSAGEEGGFFRASTYWIGWHMIWVLVRRQAGAPYPAGLILKDLEDLLHHKGFRPFQGWPAVPGPLHSPAGGLWYRNTSIGGAPPPLLMSAQLPQWAYRRGVR